jgi:hypothetical protein
MRSAFDKLISFTGLALVAVLIAAGGLLVWANTFIGDQVHDQLVMQDITMPTKEATAEMSKADRDALAPYYGSKLDTGPEAKAFADHYILVHMNTQSNNKTYSEVSGEYMKAAKDPNADPKTVAALGELRQSLFMGNTLRGLLLNAYAFGTMGTIALYAGIAALIAAALLLVLAVLGLRHAKQADDEAVAATAAPQPVPTA